MTVHELDLVARNVLASLADAAGRALILAAIAAGVLALFRVKRASLRLRVWTLVLYGAVLLPMAVRFLPAVALPLPVFEITGRPGGPAQPMGGAVTVTSAGVASSAPGLVAGLALVYLVGVVWLAGRAARAWLAGRRLERACRPVTDRGLLDRAGRHSSALGLRRTPRLLEAPDLDVPVTTSVLRPAVVLPEGWRYWPPSTVDAVLLHELSHVAGGDTSHTTPRARLSGARLAEPAGVVAAPAADRSRRGNERRRRAFRGRGAHALRRDSARLFRRRSQPAPARGVAHGHGPRRQRRTARAACSRMETESCHEDVQASRRICVRSRPSGGRAHVNGSSAVGFSGDALVAVFDRRVGAGAAARDRARRSSSRRLRPRRPLRHHRRFSPVRRRLRRLLRLLRRRHRRVSRPFRHAATASSAPTTSASATLVFESGAGRRLGEGCVAAGHAGPRTPADCCSRCSRSTRRPRCARRFRAR